jgi:outer membrane receptor protein involved in Fe transport
MSKPLRLLSLMLLSSALVSPAVARAQAKPADPAAPPVAAPPADAPPAPTPEAAPADAPVEAAPDVSIPGGRDLGGEIVVTGRRNANIARTAPEVVAVLSTADIARTGEGNIAGALGRVTGLSVVGSGFVYVRGLGDRYSLALLNGSPLPSPEPLKRVVPLDLFPTNIVASSLVQKSYSANFPGEFGGGVINLTTKAIPTESFVTLSGSMSGDSETTQRLGYTYYGSSLDWSGFTNANRNTPPALLSFLQSGERISSGTVNTQAIASQLFNGRNSVVQRNSKIPFNGSASVTAGTFKELGDYNFGVIATAGYSTRWRTRDTTQQTASSVDLSQKELDFRRVITDNRIVVNGLLGLGLEWEGNKVRWTNLYIRDTLKQARLGQGTRATGSPNATLLQQSTAWFERQLIDSHITFELRLTPELRLDVRGGYANSQREAPNEYSFEYFRSNQSSDPFGNFFINRLNNGQQGSATASFSDLNEGLWSTGADLSYKVSPALTATFGYAMVDTARRTERRDFLITASNTMPTGVALLRPDFLLQPSVINAFGIGLIDTNEGNPVFDARLRNHAAYAQIQADITDELSINAGVRFETAEQTVDPVQVFKVPTASLAGTRIQRNYFLPAVTLTYDLADDMQVRVNASKTIARPQFRELIFQLFFDPDSNRLFRGNPLLSDSQLYNAEARYEWYFARDQRLSVAGFYKKIKNPIETFASFVDNTVITSFANAPEADLYGAELETQKYFDLEGLGGSEFWTTRRAVVVANYTYTKSKIKVGANDPIRVFASASTKASDFFRDGAPLTGQSDHLVNLQLGIEDTEKLSQYTMLVTYASDRVTSRGASLQPDIIERPGIQLDFVGREAVEVGGRSFDVKVEARNILGAGYREFQTNRKNTVFFNRYKVGTSISVGVSTTF